jgi:outer membrane protein assembly factor BamB
MRTPHPPELHVEPFANGASGFRGVRLRIKGHDAAIPTPAFHNGRLFFGGGFASYEVYAVDAATGALAWQLRTTDDGPTAVTIADGLATYNTESCTVEVVDTASGERIWSRWLGDPLLAQPAVSDGRLFIAWPHAGQHRFGAFGLRDGRPLWETELAHDIITAPVVCGGGVYVSSFDGAVSCFDAATGQRRWRREMNATSAPWVVGDAVYVAQRTAASGHTEPGGFAESTPFERTADLDVHAGRLRKATRAKRARYYQASWAAEAKTASYGMDSAVGFAAAPAAAKIEVVDALVGESTISRAWRHQGSRPVVIDGVLFETTGDALEARTLEPDAIKWSWRGAEACGGNRALTPPAVANGRVLAGTADGRIIQWDAETGAIRFEVSVGAPVHWMPIMAKGLIAAGLEDGSLVVFDTGDAANDGWAQWGGAPGHNGPACATPLAQQEVGAA